MNYATIKKTDVANGPGIRVSLFVSGCTHGCKGCFNQEAWDFAYGQEFTPDTMEEILKALSPSYIRGLSVLGGEPLEPQNRKQVLQILRTVKEFYPDKDIWCYTGYTYETDLCKWIEEGDEGTAEILSLLNVLVDGEFVEERKNLKLKFRGSENQRLIDVPATLSCGKIVTLSET